MSERDTQYADLAAYLWRKLSKDYHLSDFLTEYFEEVVANIEEKLVEPDSEYAKQQAMNVANQYMHEPMKLMIAQCIYDFFSTSTHTEKNTQESP